MSQKKFDVIIVGAGVAGLSCAQLLMQKGLKVIVLEGQSRIGGRIRTIREPVFQIPIELGAEFIHGHPSSTLNYMDSLGLPFYDACDNHLFFQGSQLKQEPKFWDQLQEIMKNLKADRKKDRSVQEFLGSVRKFDSKTLSLFQSFVEGFHAADLNQISEKGLALTEQTDEGDMNQSKIFRIPGGYDQLVQGIFHSFPSAHEVLRLNHIVKKVNWRRQNVTVHSQSPSGLTLAPLQSRALIVTVPLGVLQAPPTSIGAIEFDPVPRGFESSLSGMRMGDVQRIVFRFRHRFWDDLSPEPIGFLHSDRHQYFSTWWTLMPLRVPVLIAWEGGPKAAELAQYPEEERVHKALSSLSKLTNKSLSYLYNELQSWATHNWSADPFVYGAYSYIAVDGSEKFKLLTRSFEETLYFAGEATAAGSTRGTVHGALDSGIRVAHQILKKHATQEIPESF